MAKTATKRTKAKAQAQPASKPAAALDQITTHFRVAEFNCHDGTPVPSASHPALKRLCELYLEPMRERFGVAQVLSGYRTKAYNVKIGGAKKSQHIYDEHVESVAGDVRFETGTPAEWAAHADKIAKQVGAGGVGTYIDSRFVHIDNREGQARWSGFQG